MLRLSLHCGANNATSEEHTPAAPMQAAVSLLMQEAGALLWYQSRCWRVGGGASGRLE